MFHLIFLPDETGLKVRHSPFPQEAHSLVRGADTYTVTERSHRVSTGGGLCGWTIRWPIMAHHRGNVGRGGYFCLEGYEKWKVTLEVGVCQVEQMAR